jgi:hypothetical protein
MAAKEGLLLALENSYDKVILEVDSNTLKFIVDSRVRMRSLIGGICFDITELGRSFYKFKIIWVCREANSVTHRCASMVSAQSAPRLDYISEWLLDIAAID